MQVIDGEDLEVRVVDDLVSLVDVGALETSDDGDLEVQSLDSVDETSSNVITSDDTAEDVDEDGRDLGVAGDELKRLFNGSRSSTTTDIQEVGGLTTVQLDDIHSSHGETSTVDETADVTVELDEVEARLGSTNLVSILLSGITPLKDLLLSEIGVVVETELGIHAQNLVVGGLGKRVNLNLCRVLLEEDLVELLDGVPGLLDALLAEAKLSGNLTGHVVSHADVDVNIGGVDGVGVLLGNRLDIHAALRRGDDDGALGSTIHENSKIELATRKLAFTDVDRVAETALGASLLGDELVTNHLLGKHLGLVRRVDDTNTTLEAIVEATLTTTTSQNLSLDYHILGADLLSDLLGLVTCPCDGTLGDADSILLTLTSSVSSFRPQQI